MKKNPTQLFNFCKIHDETLTHLFWECTVTQSLIEKVCTVVKNREITFTVDCKSFILGYTNKGFECYNMLCLEIKRYLFLCKRKCILSSFIGLKRSLKLALSIISKSYKIEKYKSYWYIVELLVIDGT